MTAGLGVRTLSDACDAAQTKRLAALMFSLKAGDVAGCGARPREL